MRGVRCDRRPGVELAGDRDHIVGPVQPAEHNVGPLDATTKSLLVDTKIIMFILIRAFFRYHKDFKICSSVTTLFILLPFQQGFSMYAIPD